ncbi:B12-binding domain-containing radical SAM protein [Planctomycetota bacterium]
MELPPRSKGDMLLAPGELTAIRYRLRTLAPQHDLTTVIACAFDRRTRVLPFLFADLRIAPAGVRAIGSALVDSGLNKTRIVLQHWNRHFRPSQMQVNGRLPDMFLVSSMQVHAAACYDLIRDACRIDPARRPLIIVGGPKVIYEPWDVFNIPSPHPTSADVAVTGEEYVLLSLLEVLLSAKASGESMRSVFLRARDAGLLDHIPGLVYAKGSAEERAETLVDTGIQRLTGNLDELPDPVLGYGLLERPSRRPTLASRAIPSHEVRNYASIVTQVMTFGCKFSCPYCPIPAYNQRHHRVKSGQKLADEMVALHKAYGFKYVFGTDDNFFNDHERTLGIVEIFNRTEINGQRLRKSVRWATEATVHDTLKLKDHLRDIHRAGLYAIWTGVEDMSGGLVKKGQSEDKTLAAFQAMTDHGIYPMAMMMHHDGQPLLSFRNASGLINQVHLLRKAGAISMQALMIFPATGSRMYEDAYTSGLIYEQVGKHPVTSHMLDGNYIVASHHKRPWTRQLNLILTYFYFYNPLRFLIAIVHPKSRSGYLVDMVIQWLGMLGTVYTFRRTCGWTLRLMFRKIKRTTTMPVSTIPVRSPDGSPAPHALPGTPLASKTKDKKTIISAVQAQQRKTSGALTSKP